MKKLLILGGTRQVGRRLIEVIMEKFPNDFQITLFNRGKTNPHLFPNIRRIVGDRKTNDIEQIFDESWDIVLDCTAYEPFSVEKTLNGLKGKN
jgi:2'-hydroxyisoflavone reductase